MTGASERYAVGRAPAQPEMRGLWDGGVWGGAPALRVARFRPEGSSHRPRTECKLLFDDAHLFVIFRVEDRYVRCVRTRFQDAVHKDSCVELFVQPKPDLGYFNFEFNCGGAMSVSYIRDPQRVPGGFKDAEQLGPDADRRVERFHSMPSVVEPEVFAKTTWLLEAAIPVAVLELHVGPIPTLAGSAWRANAFKCADETSHPHWASWAPVRALNFHAPESFGTIRFAAGAGSGAA